MEQFSKILEIKHDIIPELNLYKTTVISMLTYVSKMWVMMECSKIQSGEIQFLQNTSNYIPQNIIRNEDNTAELQEKDIILSTYRRQCHHLERMMKI